MTFDFKFFIFVPVDGNCKLVITGHFGLYKEQDRDKGEDDAGKN